MRDRIVETFMAATKTVFSTMVGPGLELGTDPGGTHEYEISGVVGISGDYAGTIILGFPAATALQVAKSFAGIEKDGDDLNDAVGELANMVAGSGKAKLGDNLAISLPNVIRGKRHSIAQGRDVISHIHHCTFRGHPFTVEVRIRPSR